MNKKKYPKLLVAKWSPVLETTEDVVDSIKNKLGTSDPTPGSIDADPSSGFDLNSDSDDSFDNIMNASDDGFGASDSFDDILGTSDDGFDDTQMDDMSPDLDSEDGFDL